MSGQPLNNNDGGRLGPVTLHLAQLDIETIEQLPIKPVSKDEQAVVVALVDKMLSLNKQLNDPAFVDQREALQKEINETDKKIDEKVFEIYGLTETERMMVRNAS